MTAIKHIVAGADGSAESAAALRWAAELAHATGARVTIVHAADLVERFRAHARDEDAFEDDLRKDVDRDCCAPLRQHGVVYDVVVRPGPPAEMLSQVAIATDGDLIVVGRRGGGRSDLGSLGSTSRQLASESAVPVVVVPSADD